MDCIVYLSNSASRYDSLELKQLVIQSARKNKKIGITGYLYTLNNKFIQYLEGEEPHLSSLIDLIREDKRHNVVYLNRSTVIGKRRFPTWSMKNISSSGTSLEGILVDHFSFINNLSDKGMDNYSEPTNVIWQLIDQLSKHSTDLEETS